MFKIKIRLFIFSISLVVFACGSAQSEQIKKENNETFKLLGDSIVEYKLYYTNGNLKKLTYYNRNKHLQGLYNEWYENGKRKTEWNYLDNKLNGKQITWDENGKIDSESNYFHGEKDGNQRNFRNGDTLSTEYYSKGKLISRKVPADYYTPSKLMMDGLLSEGLDSINALRILRDNLSGYIVRDGMHASFIEDSSVVGLIGSVVNQAPDISKNKFGNPITYKYLKEKGLNKEQIDYLIKNGYVKIEDKKQISNTQK